MSRPTPDIQDVVARFRELLDVPEQRASTRAHFEICLRTAMRLRLKHPWYRDTVRGHIAMLRAIDVLDSEQGVETRSRDRRPPQSPAVEVAE